MIDSRLGRLWKAVRLGCWWELGRIHSRINDEGGGGGGLGSGVGRRAAVEEGELGIVERAAAVEEGV